MMADLKQYEFWFVTGSQHLYGEETLVQVKEHSQIIAQALDQSEAICGKVVFKGIVTTPSQITRVMEEANFHKIVQVLSPDAYISPQDVDCASILNKPLYI